MPEDADFKIRLTFNYPNNAIQYGYFLVQKSLLYFGLIF
jgi:hypothetical protein